MQQNNDMQSTVTGEVGSAAVPHVIIPGNDLVQVPDPTEDFYRNVGLLQVKFSGSSASGTGTLVTDGAGKYGIITAAHVVYDTTTGGPAQSATFIPAQTLGAARPFVYCAASNAIRIPDGYQGNGGGPLDYALIRISAAVVPDILAPFADMQPLDAGELHTVQVTGYPGPGLPGQPRPAMFYGQGTGNTSLGNPNQLRYDASTLSGMSGSGVCPVNKTTGDPDLAVIAGIHVSGHYNAAEPAKSYNWAVYLTNAIIAWLEGQMTA